MRAVYFHPTLDRFHMLVPTWNVCGVVSYSDPLHFVQEVVRLTTVSTRMIKISSKNNADDWWSKSSAFVFSQFPPPLPSQHPPANAWTCCFHSNQVYNLQVSGPPQVAGNCWRKNALRGSKAANLFSKRLASHLPNGTKTEWDMRQFPGKLVHNFELNNLHLISKDDPTRSPNFIR